MIDELAIQYEKHREEKLEIFNSEDTSRQSISPSDSKDSDKRDPWQIV
jgi:hypothetical protein